MREDQLSAGRPLRANGQRNLAAILGAADQVLSRDPAASMEEVAQAAGVARTTVHRHFPTRNDLIAGLTLWAAERLTEAVQDARPQSAPPLVALHQMTVNVLTVKAGWAFAMSNRSQSSESERLHTEVRRTCHHLFGRAQEAGHIAMDADIVWVQRVYYALIREVLCDEEEIAADDAATRIVTTLLGGAGRTALP